MKIFSNKMVCTPFFFFFFSQNILPDENLNAKVADFGLTIPTQVITTTTFLPSNRGYLALDYFEVQVGPYTDVYSYGVVSLHYIVIMLLLMSLHRCA